ncbi:MAG TPA: thioesterase family protein [Actinomycetota bacterium]
MSTGPELGATGEASRTVREQDTATAVGSGEVPVFSTPMLCALIEDAAVAAVAGALPEGAVSVGTRIELDHLKASAVGARVRATARVTSVEGRAIGFACEAFEGDTLIGRATHTRAVVDRARFLERL